jgi:hypothetical protein
VDESFTWAGGTFAGAGRTIVPEGVSLTLNISTLHRVQRTFINRGSVTLAHGFLWVDSGGDWRNQAGSTFALSDSAGGSGGEVRAWGDGAFRLPPGATLEVQAGTISGVSTSTVELLGTVHKTGTGDFNLLAEGGETGGTFTIDQGTVLIRYGTHAAEFSVVDGASLRAIGVGSIGPVFTASSSVSGGGTLVCGDAEFAGTIDVGRLSVLGRAGETPRAVTLTGPGLKRAAYADVQDGLLALAGDVVLSVTGDLLLISGGVSLSAASATAFTRIDVGGVLTIAEPAAMALEVSLVGGYTPTPGESLEIITFGAGSGEFESLEVLPAHPGESAALEYQPAAIVLNFLPG